MGGKAKVFKNKKYTHNRTVACTYLEFNHDPLDMKINASTPLNSPASAPSDTFLHLPNYALLIFCWGIVFLSPFPHVTAF